jgi:hypothetical protein
VKTHDLENGQHLASYGRRLQRDSGSEVDSSARLVGEVELSNSLVAETACVVRSKVKSSRITGSATVLDADLDGCDVSGTAIVAGRWSNLRVSTGTWFGPPVHERGRRGQPLAALNADDGIRVGDGAVSERVLKPPDHSIEAALAALQREREVRARQLEQQRFIDAQRGPDGAWRRVGGVTFNDCE